MTFYFRKRASLGRGVHLNMTKTGVSASKRVGRVTFNSRGRLSVRVLPGLTFRTKL